MEIKVINKAIIDDVYTMLDAIQANKEALAIYSRNGSIIPLRTNIDVTAFEGQSLYMPGYAADAHALGVKIVSVYPNNIAKGIPSVPSTMVLIDDETGQVIALLDGTYLTQVRTGAVAGAATDLLARQDSKVFTIFGAGGQAESQVDAVLAVRDIEQVYVCDLDEARREAFAAHIAEKHHVKAEAAASAEDAVRQSDIITCVTTTRRPLFDASWLKAGAHVNGIGSYTPEMQEIPAEAILNADGVYVDTFDGVLNEAGDFIKPISEGMFTNKIITGELGDVVNGTVVGRKDASQITVFKSTGSAVMDVVNARRIYEKALAHNAGDSINL